MVVDSILCLTMYTNSMVMELNETIEKQYIVYWYSTAVEEDLKAAESLYKETFTRLMSKYAREIKLIDILIYGNSKNVRQAK